jgi:DNA-binding transcriptional MerR regulator
MSEGNDVKQRGPSPNKPIIRKAYYSIGEVCELTGLKPHVLRYWETQFRPLQPSKNRAGNRVYRPPEIELILLVKHLLYKERFTIEGARQKLKEIRGAGEMDGAREEVLEPELLALLREELQVLRDILQVPESTKED